MTKAFLSAMALGAFFSAAALADEVAVSKNSVSKEETSSTAVSADPSIRTTTVTKDPSMCSTSVSTESPEALQVKTHKQKVSAETVDTSMDNEAKALSIQGERSSDFFPFILLQKYWRF